MREYDWTTVPWRDAEWEKHERYILGEDKFEQEHLCHFLGSQGTLISGKILRTLVYREPVKLLAENKMKVYKEPQANTLYLITADTSYGKDLDYSAFIVYDISKTPYEMVATFKCNETPSELYPSVLCVAAKYYNSAWIFAENNDIGSKVLHILINDL